MHSHMLSWIARYRVVKGPAIRKERDNCKYSMQSLARGHV